MSRSSGDRNTVSTADYIPGTTLQGIFAGLFFKNGRNEEEFFKLFFGGTLCFSNGYITVVNNSSYQECHPVPFSIQKNKATDEICDLLHKDYDSNIQTLSLAHTEGKYGAIKNETILLTNVDKSINFHHERDNESGTSKEGMIFNYESIEKEQIFSGFISGSDEELKSVRELLPVDGIVNIGRSKNSQYGRAKFEWLDNEAIMQTIEKDYPVGIEDISLTFLSDVILYNEFGHAVASAEILEKYLRTRLTNGKACIKKAFIKTGIVESYVAKWKMKKPSDICFLAGSCFLLSGLTDSDLKILAAIQETGIGMRRQEGYGRIVFGLQDSDDLKRISPENSIVDDETGIPELTRQILHESIKDYILRFKRIQALKDEKEFTLKNGNRITKSLVSRLEAFVENSSTLDEFKNQVARLRKDASEKLKDLSFDSRSFYDYLIASQFSAKDIIENSKNKKLREIIELSGFYDESVQNKSVQNDLFKEYYLTFFRSLRKSLKKPESIKKGVENG